MEINLNFKKFVEAVEILISETLKIPIEELRKNFKTKEEEILNPRLPTLHQNCIYYSNFNYSAPCLYCDNFLYYKQKPIKECIKKF